MPTFLLGWIGYALIFAAGLASGGYGMYQIEQGTIQSLKAEYAQADAARANAVLKQFTDTADKINKSVDSYHTTQKDLNTKIDLISKDLQNVQAKRPLPRDCKPDPDRLRNANAAIAAANSAIKP